jgi:membrane associated rhomboid family serine protease
MLFPLYDLNPHRRFPWFTLLIIAANFAVTAWMSTLGQQGQAKVALELGFVPERLSQVGKGPIDVPLLGIDPRTGRPRVEDKVALSADPADVYPTFLTTMFLHGGWMHLVMNMWMLWIFGNNVEDRLGHFLYLAYYLAGGIVATVVFWMSDPHGVTPVVGASGAVAAVLGGYAVTFPTAKVRTLVFIFLIVIVDIPALVWLGIWFVTQLISGVIGLWGVAMEPVAFWAHIGGFVAGMILMPVLSLGASPLGTDWRKESDEMFRFDDPRVR